MDARRGNNGTVDPLAAQLAEVARRRLGEELAAVMARLVDEAGPEDVIRCMDEVLRHREEVRA